MIYTGEYSNKSKLDNFKVKYFIYELSYLITAILILFYNIFEFQIKNTPIQKHLDFPLPAKMSSSQPPRRNLPRYQSVRQAPTKKQSKLTFTHQDFLSFIEPFYELLKKKNFEELKKIYEPKNFEFRKETYAKWAACLNEKLLSSYRFEDDVDIPECKYDTPLETKKLIKPIEYTPGFYEKNNILENYRTSAFKNALKAYQSQVATNNERRKAILRVVPERVKLQGYFCAFDLINCKLEEIQRKRCGYKKKIKSSEFEAEMIREYLDRIYEFYDVFGLPDQFSPDELNYPDIITNVTENEADSDVCYFR